jgi:Ser/Thr protein kinase RdoA (MazF antagonist)
MGGSFRSAGTALAGLRNQRWCYTDIRQGNILACEGRAYLLDFEDVVLGPRQWDMTALVGSVELGWLTDDDYARFVVAYGYDHRGDPDMDVLVDISLFRRTCWLASRTGREPALVEDVRHRLAMLVDPSPLQRWRRS